MRYKPSMPFKIIIVRPTVKLRVDNRTFNAYYWNKLSRTLNFGDSYAMAE